MSRRACAAWNVPHAAAQTVQRRGQKASQITTYWKNLAMSMTGVKESAIVLGFLVATIIPARIAMYHLVSDYWLGSVGVMSCMMAAIVYLSHKDKLGYIGRLFNNKMRRMRTSRWATGLLVFQGFLLVFSGIGLAIIDMEPDEIATSWPFELLAFILHQADEVTDSWMSHMLAYVFVESAEAVGILAYFKLFAGRGAR